MGGGGRMDAVEAGVLSGAATAGAYCANMGHTYRSRPLGPEVRVAGDKWAVVRARPPMEALIAGDSIPDWLGGSKHSPCSTASLASR